MDSKKTHTLSKATVATVVAASGVLVAMPQPSNAATFSDLNPYADYYEPVIDLVNRNIATGYPDGTFKPNQAITRADAAKMLALAIDVNIANPKNPGFKDVNVNNGNYRYIAALAEAGIINGFTDNTFKPNEPITRGQMAKIITLGFQFGMSSKLNNSFRDVSPTNFAAYYIQTLVDLNVTKGTTTVTFDPFKNVTRAQMASFVWRAEKADRGTPIYTVGDVAGNTIYINGVAHTVASHLRSVINASNKNILKGAYIEGTFANNTLTNITKLTLNASGSSSRLLALDGNYTSFAGELVINGSYVRLKNLNFTGRVEVAETPRRSLATLQNVRIASVGNLANFIDWEKPTESKNDDFLNPIDNETLKDKTNNSTKPTSKYKDRMANIEKYVDFEGSDIRNLVVTGDRAFIKGDSVIDRLTVRGDVTNFELYADAKAMYLDNDYNMTVYGVHDIQYVYKNALKNVKFNTDSTYDYYYVTTKSGYTDLGEFAYINDAIIPKGTTVNTNFDDFETDEPNIGYIEDENGTPVSRDPVGDTIIADLSAPKITQLDVKAGGTIADGTITVDEDGMYYYVIKKANEKAPTISEIKTGEVPLSGNGPVLMDEKAPFQKTGLEAKTEYVLYAIAIDGSDNVSEKKSVKFSTIDSKPPTLTLDKGDKMYGGKRVQFKLTPSEEGKIYYYIRPDSSAPKPTVDDVIEKHTATLDAKEPGTIIETAFKHGIKPNLDDILPNTPYQIFAVMVDKSGNKMRLVEEIKITTESPDLIHPYVVNGAILERDTVESNKDKNYFYLYVSEELDKESAENVENYTLSGTGIVNVSGQKEIKPTEAVYIGGKTPKVRLTVPSLTALVKGDTIRVIVSKKVKDLAENEFENEGILDTVAGEKPRNYAEYVHSDTTSPEIKIKGLTTDGTQYLVDINANKAGTYYYMIMPSNYNFDSKGISMRDFVDEFDINTKTGKYQSQLNGKNENDYKGMGQGTATYGESTLLIDIPKDLDPFTTYSIYMVLKDRAGLISSKYDSMEVIKDSKAPLVTIGDPTPIQNKDNNGKEVNDKVRFDVTSDESGYLHVIGVRKYIYNSTEKKYELNEDFFEKVGNEVRLKPIQAITSASDSKTQREAFDKLKSGKGVKSFTEKAFDQGTKKPVEITGLDEHEEYGFYLAVEDINKNFTVYSRRSNDNPPAIDEPNGNQLTAYVYTDAFKPYITNDSNREIVKPSDQGFVLNSNEAIIYKDKSDVSNSNDETFTITFNEAIMRKKVTGENTTGYNDSMVTSANWMNLFDINGTAPEINYTFVSYKEGINTTDQSQLIIKPNANISSQANITITMKDSENVFDYEKQNTFEIAKIGRYIYPNQHAVNIQGIWNYSPYFVRIRVEATVPVPYGQRFYYAVMNKNATVHPTFEEVKRAAEGGAKISGMTITGTDVMKVSNDSSRRWDLKLPNNAVQVFGQNQKIYFYTIDSFGNIIQGKNSDNTLNHIIIPAQTTELP